MTKTTFNPIHIARALKDSPPQNKTRLRAQIKRNFFGNLTRYERNLVYIAAGVLDKDQMEVVQSNGQEHLLFERMTTPPRKAGDKIGQYDPEDFPEFEPLAIATELRRQNRNASVDVARRIRSEFYQMLSPLSRNHIYASVGLISLESVTQTLGLEEESTLYASLIKETP